MNQIDVIAWARRAAEAARKCHEWMQGEFSDSDFDRDGKLSEADAAAFTVAYDADKAIAAIAALHSQAQEREWWRPIETAPVDVEVWLFDPDTDPKQYAAKLVEREYEEGGYYWRPAEELVADVLDYELTPTHWMPLPAAPTGGSET